MTHLYKTFGFDKLIKLSALDWRPLLAGLALIGLSALPMVANAQTAACAPGQPLLNYSFAAPTAWPDGATSINYLIGTGPNAVIVTGTLNLGSNGLNNSAVDARTGVNRATPNTSQSGNINPSYYFLVDNPLSTTINSVTFSFSKPVNSMQLVVTDIDSGANANRPGSTTTGGYQDRATVTGVGVGGAAILPAAAANTASVTAAGNVASSSVAPTVGGANCADTVTACNATFSFAQPITSFTLTYDSVPGTATTGGYGNPPPQVVGLASMAFCVQEPNLSLVKDDGGLSFTAGGAGSYSFVVTNNGAGATVNPPAVVPSNQPAGVVDLPTTVKDVLPAGMSFATPLTPTGTNAAAWTCAVSTTTNANDTATCTTTTPIAGGGTSTFALPVSVAATVVGGTTLTNRAKVYGGGDPNKLAETTTGAIAACPSDGLAGAVANAGCGFEPTPIVAAAGVVISKTDNKSVAAPGSTNNYVVTLSNQGPSVANGVIVTDVVGAGLTCPATNVVTCTVTGAGAVCPAGPLTIASLTTGVTVATLPVNGALQFAYTCNVN
jgi:uncharacterized repeat protein (TIGR01451 family)